MIEMMRNKAASWVAKILAFLLILSFAVWGIGDMVRGPIEGDVIAKVGGTEISQKELNNQVRSLVSIMRRQLGGNFDAQQAAKLGLIDQTVDQLINTRLLQLEAQNLGLGVGEDLIRQTIFEDQRFRTRGNKFDRLTFNRFLRQEDLSEAKYVELLKQEIAQKQITNALRASSYAPKSLVNILYKYRNEKRIAEIINIPYGNPSKVRSPSEAELIKFYKENPESFTAPEYRNITAIFLDPVEVAKELSPDQAKVKEEYEFRKVSRSVPERRYLEQLLFQDKAKANSVYKNSQSVKNFSFASKEFSKILTDLGNLRIQDLPTALGEAAFKLRVNGITKPIQTGLGWHVLHIKKITPGKTPSFNSLKAEIRRDLAREIAVDKIVNLTGKLDDTLAGGATLETAAAMVFTKIIRFKAVDSLGNNPQGKPVTGLPDSSLFLEKIFSTPKGETTNIEETQKGEFFVLKVEAITPPKLKPMSAVRKEIAIFWKQNQVRLNAKTKAKLLQKAAKMSSTLTKKAKTIGYSIYTSQPVSRFANPQNSKVPSSILGPLFKAKQKDIVIAPSNDGYLVAQVKEIIAAETNKTKAKTESLKTQLQNLVAADAVGQYLSALRRPYPVTIDQKAVTQAIIGRQ